MQIVDHDRIEPDVAALARDAGRVGVADEPVDALVDPDVEARLQQVVHRLPARPRERWSAAPAPSSDRA